MPRTKQTACKSTGGLAPRKMLAWKCAGGGNNRVPKRPFLAAKAVELGNKRAKQADGVQQDDVPSLDSVEDGQDMVLDEDLSKGKELVKLRVINTYNDQEMDPFEYITSAEHAENVDLPCKNSPIVRPKTHFQVVFKDQDMGWSLQTLEDIDAGAPLFEYTGVLSKVGPQNGEANLEVDDDYIVGFEHDGHKYQLDALHKGNLARFVNHSCQPNCFTLLTTTTANSENNNGTTTNAVQLQQDDGTNAVDDQQQRNNTIANNKDNTTTKTMMPSVLFYAMRRIFAGEELTIDYGERWWLAKADSLCCLCGSEECQYDDDWCADVLRNAAEGVGRRQTACKAATGARRQMALKAVPRRPPMARIGTGPSIGQWSGMDTKLTGDQLAQLVGTETEEDSDEEEEEEADEGMEEEEVEEEDKKKAEQQ